MANSNQRHHRAQIVFNRVFENGDRVLFHKAHHSHSLMLQNLVNQEATVIDVGRHIKDGNVKYLVRFEKSDWWISEKHLQKILR